MLGYRWKEWIQPVRCAVLMKCLDVLKIIVSFVSDGESRNQRTNHFLSVKSEKLCCNIASTTVSSVSYTATFKGIT